MSMNLRLFVDGEQVYLHQTPTSITYECLSQNGKTSVSGELYGSSAIDAILIYEAWMISRCKNDNDRAYVEKHMNCIRYALELASSIDAIMVDYI